MYKFYYLLRKYKRQLFPAEKVKLIYLFFNKYVAHFVIILLVIGLSFSNLFTTEIKAEGFGEKSLLYALTTGSNPEESYVEESITPSPTPKNIQTKSGAASPQLTSGQPQTTEEAQQNTIISTGGSALVKPEITSMEVNQDFRDELIEYLVKDGDTLGSIAEDFDITPETIIWENNLTKTSIIRPGQKLQILPINGVSYKVVKGDTLGKIAAKFKADKAKIIEFNRLTDETDINVKDILIIPEGQPYYPTIQPARLAPFRQIFQEPADTIPTPVEGKMLWPNGCRRISQYFNWRHAGLDIACNAGTPIRAAEDGVVYKVAYLKTGYGHHVFIDHGSGKTTRYGHMSTIFVTEGQAVKQGQAIGLEGSTGRSTGPHLHFEVRFNNKAYNPLSYIK